MYTAINNRLIIKMPDAEQKTESGIIVVDNQDQSPVIRMEVVECGDNPRFKGKVVLAERRLVRELSTKGYGSVAIADLLAVETD